MEIKEIISDVRSNCECKSAGYCPLEKIVERNSPRLFEQHKCVEIFKWERHMPDGDEGWRQAYECWVNEGYAAIFGGVYHDGMKYQELIREINKQKKIKKED